MSGQLDHQPNDFSSQKARLVAMAAKLRAEAAELEAVQQRVFVENLSQLFNAFDTNKDGKVSVEELKSGLSKVLSQNVNEGQASKILKQLDTSGDGALQLDEFRGIEIFRSKFEKILAEERNSAQLARNAANEALEAAKKAEAVSLMINNKPPTLSDKIVSLLPFFLPFLDLLPYGKTFIIDTHQDGNVLIGIVGFLYALYQTVPFAGLIAFFLFNLFSSNLQLNRLIRYNIQLAIFLDIALIIPGVFGAIADLALKSLSVPLPPVAYDAAATATFLIFSSVILYSVVSSLAGVEPDKIPFITERVKQRVPTTEEFQKMYDDFQAAVEEDKKRPRTGQDKDGNSKDSSEKP
jgi:hypothetical protein